MYELRGHVRLRPDTLPYFYEVRWSFLLTRLEYPYRRPIQVCSGAFERGLPKYPARSLNDLPL